MEPRGSGVNKFTYFATNDLLSEWQELPLATPEFLQLARQIKVLFTGDLNSKVISNPHFPGEEKDLLRAQIARISFNCSLVPAGIFKVNEDDAKEIEPVEQDETFKAPGYKELCSLKHWQHLN